ncbi:MAG: tetratricopeptide repeat protein, partial [Bacteroidia bacterium]|nr:tetratricopeptide repeat protein [Bacteroidia bacterium]
KKQQVITLVSRGDVELTKKNFDVAISNYQEALKLQPGDFNINRKLEEARAQKQKILSSAMSTAAQKTQISSKVIAEQHLAQAINLVKQGKDKYDEAIRILQKAGELDPSNIRIWFNLGVIFHNLKRYEEAITCYKKALQINPNDNNVNRNIGIAYIFVNNLEDARKHLELALKANLQDQEARDNLAAIYDIMGDSLKKEAQQIREGKDPIEKSTAQIPSQPK